VQDRWKDEEGVGRDEKERRCAALFQGWLDAQAANIDGEGGEDGSEGDGGGGVVGGGVVGGGVVGGGDSRLSSDVSDDAGNESKPPADALTLHSFVDALGQLPSVSVPSVETAEGVRRITDAFRRFDTSASGMIGIADFVGVVLDAAPSRWLPEAKPKMNLALAGRRLTAVARLGAARILPHPNNGEGGTGGGSGEEPRSAPTADAASTSATPPPNLAAVAASVTVSGGKRASSSHSPAKSPAKRATKDKLRKASKLVMIATPSKASRIQPQGVTD
jgi:hypothetical protein